MLTMTRSTSCYIVVAMLICVPVRVLVCVRVRMCVRGRVLCLSHRMGYVRSAAYNVRRTLYIVPRTFYNIYSVHTVRRKMYITAYTHVNSTMYAAYILTTYIGRSTLYNMLTHILYVVFIVRRTLNVHRYH